MGGLLKDIGKVAPFAVAFNWESCGECGKFGFGDNDASMGLIAVLLEKGHMVMVSDNSLKALIADWKEPTLGPCPFVNVGGFNDKMKISGSCQTLQDCKSNQLQVMGHLASSGTVSLGSGDGTICVAIDADVVSNNAYQIELLTVLTEVGSAIESAMPNITNLASLPPNLVSKVGTHQGLVGHAMLTYPSGGCLSVTCAQWADLSDFEVKEDAFFQVCAELHDEDYCQRLKDKFGQMAQADKAKFLQDKSAKLIQENAPCNLKRPHGLLSAAILADCEAVAQTQEAWFQEDTSICQGLYNGKTCLNHIMRDSAFCRKCGTRAPGHEIETIACTALHNGQPCGNQMLPDIKFCRKCGNKNAAAGAPASKAPAAGAPASKPPAARRKSKDEGFFQGKPKEFASNVDFGKKDPYGNEIKEWKAPAARRKSKDAGFFQGKPK